ncbi:hypothetical protein ABW19_dt0200471 [Dactylella cylindrospora]|nr:hypothetical protein ABW19_dt0200471 [Dactylella cylindrospora]
MFARKPASQRVRGNIEMGMLDTRLSFRAEDELAGFADPLTTSSRWVKLNKPKDPNTGYMYIGAGATVYEVSE